MERKKYIAGLVLFLGLFAWPGFVLAQLSSQEQIYEAYARGKMDKWYTIMSDFESNTVNPTSKQNMELLSYYYGYTGWLISVEDYDRALYYIEKSEDLMDDMSKYNNKNPTILAYRGAFIAYEIGISSYKAIYLGRRSMGLIEEALEIDPNNIQAHIEMGNAMYYCPTTFGGDKKVAIKHYKKAGQLMEKRGLVKNNWMYLNVMTSLGMAYEATDNIMDAKLCYEKILVVKPNFMWVGEELYPDMLKRHNL